MIRFPGKACAKCGKPLSLLRLLGRPEPRTDVCKCPREEEK
jgi:hypothetical protein